jgi:hypothetical protein
MTLLTPIAKVALSFVFLCACVVGTSRAELLQRFHVLGFSVRSDTTRPRVGVPFHVTLTVHVRERITQLQYVSLPTFSGVENIGDRQHLTHVRGGGSIYSETMTLVAHSPGPVAIGSAYLDAVDLRDGKTKRFISNDLILNVIGTALPSARVKARAVLLVILGLLLAAAIFALLVIFHRRRRRAAASDAAQPLINNPLPAPAIGLGEALANLRKRRDRSSVLCVREALWSIAGADKCETLGDLLQHPAARADGLRRMLIAIERAAFVHDTRLQQAIDDALSDEEQRIAR